MRFLILSLLVGLVGCAGAPMASITNKYDMEFTAQPTHAIKRVEWIAVDDVNAVCQGHAPVMNGRQYLGCTKFSANSCRVYTAKNTSLSILGHEMRHCFEGHWHN